jgi:hypothetical protein
MHTSGPCTHLAHIWHTCALSHAHICTDPCTHPLVGRQTKRLGEQHARHPTCTIVQCHIKPLMSVLTHEGIIGIQLNHQVLTAKSTQPALALETLDALLSQQEDSASTSRKLAASQHAHAPFGEQEQCLLLHVSASGHCHPWSPTSTLQSQPPTLE